MAKEWVLTALLLMGCPPIGDNELPPDGELPPDDGSSPPDAPQFCYGTGPVKPCFASNPMGHLTLSPMTINTDSSLLCSTNVMVTPTNVCVIAAAYIDDVGGTVAVIGTRPLIIVATDTISLTGTLDAASHRSPTNLDEHGQRGAGADPTGGCVFGPSPSMSGGGAGGTFIEPGGAGGAGIMGAGGTAGQAQASGLRGGCRGQDAGTALGGLGGGALYLIANTKIVTTGQINASGGGGNRGVSGNSPGGGGGSGGFIGLDTKLLENYGSVFANGGGGGEGSGGGAPGNPGEDPTGAAAANGGLGGSGGGNGGNGGAGGSSGGTLAGGNGSPANYGGGGGGGGTGVIKVYGGATLMGVHSPKPSP